MAERHNWTPITLVQKPPRMQCTKCGAVRRWSNVDSRFIYYRPHASKRGYRCTGTAAKDGGR